MHAVQRKKSDTKLSGVSFFISYIWKRQSKQSRWSLTSENRLWFVFVWLWYLVYSRLWAIGIAFWKLLLICKKYGPALSITFGVLPNTERLYKLTLTWWNLLINRADFSWNSDKYPPLAKASSCTTAPKCAADLCLLGSKPLAGWTMFGRQVVCALGKQATQSTL